MHDFCRDPVELFNDSGNPYVDSEITAEHQ
jgi:hypothetical protein